MKYIDAEKLIAEIERRIQHAKDNPQRYPDATSSIWSLQGILSFIESLEKEQSVQGPLTDEYFNRYYTENFDMIHSDLSSREIVRNIAEHFYERGLNARKEG